MYDKDDCECKERRTNKCCRDILTLEIIIALFIFVIGIIVGATTGIFALLGTAAFIIIAVALGILALVKIAIILLCCKKNC